MNQSLPAPLDVKLMNLTASVLFLCCVLLLLAAGARWVLRYPGFLWRASWFRVSWCTTMQ